jgi:uncharacterized delta-60 repeat protein
MNKESYISIAILLCLLVVCINKTNGQLTFGHEGRMDSSYGTKGVATVPGNVSVLGGSDSVITPTGEVYYAYPDNTGLTKRIIVVRQLPNGSVDASFGQNGTKDVIYPSDQISSIVPTNLAVQPDGKLLIGGYLAKLGGVDGVLMRLLSSGQLDTSFGNKGFATLDFTPENFDGRSDDVVNKVQLDSAGKILVLCSANRVQQSTNGQLYSSLTRLTNEGVVDQSFGGTGSSLQLVSSFPSGIIDEKNGDFQIQSDGKVVIAITTGSGTAPTSLVIRYLSTGTLDPTFSDDGIANISRWTYPSVTRLRVLPSQKILVFRSDTLTQLNADGSPDAGFGTGGIVTDFYFDGGTPNTFEITTDGKIVVSAWGSNGPSEPQFTVIRKYWNNGIPDIRFGQHGKKKLVIPNFYLIKILAVQDDRLLMTFCGVIATPCSAKFFLTRKP